MFDLTHAFVPGHFIRHYIVSYICFVNRHKNRKNNAVHWKSHVSAPISLDVTTKQCNR